MDEERRAFRAKELLLDPVFNEAYGIVKDTIVAQVFTSDDKDKMARMVYQKEGMDRLLAKLNEWKNRQELKDLDNSNDRS